MLLNPLSSQDVHRQRRPRRPRRPGKPRRRMKSRKKRHLVDFYQNGRTSFAWDLENLIDFSGKNMT
jgi:hypothetical protein